MVRLFEPTQADLNAEAKGRVMIYDGLTGTDSALSEQFDGPGHMMFIRVVVTYGSDKTGGTESDNGCD